MELKLKMLANCAMIYLFPSLFDSCYSFSMNLIIALQFLRAVELFCQMC